MESWVGFGMDKKVYFQDDNEVSYKKKHKSNHAVYWLHGFVKLNFKIKIFR